MREEWNMSPKSTFRAPLLVVVLAVGTSWSPPPTADDQDGTAVDEAAALAQFFAELQAAEEARAAAAAEAAAAEIAALEAEGQAFRDEIADALEEAEAVRVQYEADARAYAERLSAQADAAAAAEDEAAADALAGMARARLECLGYTNDEFDAVYGSLVGERNDGYSAAAVMSGLLWCETSDCRRCNDAIIDAVFGS